ncbi:cytochrome (ubi)quinol oxidase subunit III [Alicyclobacillus tolerans]|uniref:cytochrome (ubi)quinol oxidase subunit III n=1 Tax=Alicyclobacillus tolerans TaxID=90970 RepID=UPI001F1E58BC|nr:cytochrome (ubi)quinol oxidase subunit III [Alicyclobacillus tolerans]MCF8566757.1 cytochrome (ubi)quinol oxidase subunit III [Alicyclobacillus tolerans]
MAHDATLHHEVERPGVPLEYSKEEGELRILGFWLFLATDLILFSALFATFAVLRNNVSTGPSGADLFDIPGFTAETFILLTSSFTCGLATHSMRSGHKGGLMGWLVVTILLGMSFIGLEVNEFTTYVSAGHTMATSAFLSAFFTLVGTHGAHVSLGILWMLSILYQLTRRGITATTARKVFIVGLYWHFLDVVWVFIFTVVYLSGVMG